MRAAADGAPQSAPGVTAVTAPRAPALPRVPFAKYEGNGNDFVLVDNRHAEEPVLDAAQAVRVCDRHFGVGADGVIFALPAGAGSDADLRMRIYNSDGSEPEMCGNGIRCLANFIAARDGTSAASAPDGAGAAAGAEPTVTATYCVTTAAGPIRPQVLRDGRVRVDMGAPTLDPPAVPTTLPAVDAAGETGARVGAGTLTGDGIPSGREWRATAVSMGNPHSILFVDSETWRWADANLDAIGPAFERHAAFPKRTNTEFIEVLDARTLRLLVWERGAGRTLACGTGACAAVVAAMLAGHLPRTRAGAAQADACTVHLPGGDLQIEWDPRDDHVYMTGPASRVFDGTL